MYFRRSISVHRVWNMAENLEVGDYSSPSKRPKLDQGQNLHTISNGVDLEPFAASMKNVHEDFEGDFSVSAEVLTGGDSGFNDLTPPASQGEDSQPCTSVFDSSAHSSSQLEENTEISNAEDKDEVSSTVSNISDLSGLSDLSGQDWKPMAGSMSWVQKQMVMGANPREVLVHLVPEGTHIPVQLDDVTLWKIIVNVLSEPPHRDKLRHINTLDDAVRLLKCSSKIIVLTGAGVSVSCGIPDFRSKDGIYSRLAVDFPDLPDPQAMFDINYFRQDPRPFFKFARDIYPGQFKPSPCHRFIRLLEKQKKLLRNYSQNIDTLEKLAGIQNVIECHGSFATASCTRCKYKVAADAIREDIFAQRIPMCPKCCPISLPSTDDSNDTSYRERFYQGIMKPDIVFFGEGLPDSFHEAMAKDKDVCDLLIVIGSSLKVRPVALIPSSIPPEIPQILINREPLNHLSFDIELLGDGDVIVSQLCHMLGGEWESECWRQPMIQTTQLLPICPMKQTNCEGNGENCSKENIENNSKENNENGSKADIESNCNEDSEINGNKSDSNSNVNNSVVQCDIISDKKDTSKETLVEYCEDDPKSEDDIDALRRCWQPKVKEIFSERLPENAYYYIHPNRYIFPGAEVVYDPDDEQSLCSTDTDVDNDKSHENQSDDEDNGYWDDIKKDETQETVQR